MLRQRERSYSTSRLTKRPRRLTRRRQRGPEVWSENIPGKSPSHFHTKFSHGESESIHVPWTETPIPLEDRNGKAGLAHGETGSSRGMASSSRFELQPVRVKLARPSSAPALTAMLTRKLSTNELLTPTLFNQHPRAQLLGIVPSSPSLGAFNGHRALRASLTRASKALNHGQPAFSLLDHATAGSQLVLEATRPGHQTAARPAAALPRATTAEQPPDDEAKASSAVKLATRIYYEGCLLHEPMPVLLPTIVRL